MLYNNEWMVELIRKWALARCDDFGEGTSGTLYTSFKSWVYETRSMKHFPGPVAFGEAMRGAGYEKYRKDGRTRWVGIALRDEKDQAI